jgi:predicted TIM-barrel fold metal-dependent hydrolase
MIEDMLFIDVHNHVFKYQQTVYGYYGQPMEELMERMDKNGTDKALIFPGPPEFFPESFKEANNYIIEAVKKFPDRFIGSCMTTPVWGKLAIEEIERCAKAGLIGVKLLPHHHGYYAIDGEIMDPMMEKIAELGLILTTHSDFDHKKCSPYQVIRLAERFPKVTIMMAHMGMNSDNTASVPDLVKDHKNLILDTSAAPNLPYDVFVKPMQIVPDQVVFGSDTPTLSPEVELKKIEVAEELYGLTKEQKKKILGENAARILGL